VGELLGLLLNILHTFSYISCNPFIQGGLLVSGRARFWASSADSFGEPKQKPGGWVVEFIRDRYGIVFLKEGDHLCVHATVVGFGCEPYPITQPIGQPYDEFILILSALF